MSIEYNRMIGKYKTIKVSEDNLNKLSLVVPGLSPNKQIEKIIDTNFLARFDLGIESIYKKYFEDSKKRKFQGLGLQKKGSIFDIFAIVLLVFFVGIASVVGWVVLDSFKERGIESGILTGDALVQTEKISNKMPGMLDGAMMFLFIGLCIVTIVSAALIRVHPVFIVIFIIMSIFLLLVSAGISNAYQTFATQQNVISLTNQLTWTNWIFGYLPWIIIMMSTLLAVVMYKTYSWQEMI